MKLRYRGVDYDRVPPTLEVTEGEIMGRYRGANWRCRTLKEVPVPQPAYELQYRGVAYNSGRLVQQPVATPVRERTSVASPTAGATFARSQGSRMGHNALSEWERTHNTFIRKSLEHRLEVARRRGDRNLVALLEAEKDQLG